jgi:hypothetical protein
VSRDVMLSVDMLIGVIGVPVAESSLLSLCLQ